MARTDASVTSDKNGVLSQNLMYLSLRKVHFHFSDAFFLGKCELVCEGKGEGALKARNTSPCHKRLPRSAIIFRSRRRKINALLLLEPNDLTSERFGSR
jgi:hypothetical protein